MEHFAPGTMFPLRGQAPSESAPTRSARTPRDVLPQLRPGHAEFLRQAFGGPEPAPARPPEKPPMAQNTSSADRWWGRSTIFDKSEIPTPYMTRYWLGRLRLHIFYRGDLDPDCHDHPWPFWTFPLTSYVEEVAVLKVGAEPTLRRRVVRAFLLHYRPAEHTHRVLGRYAGHYAADDDFRPVPDIAARLRPGRVITVVWRGRGGRAWGFLKNRDGRWCWSPWRDYVFGGGKGAPCE